MFMVCERVCVDLSGVPRFAPALPGAFGLGVRLSDGAICDGSAMSCTTVANNVSRRSITKRDRER